MKEFEYHGIWWTPDNAGKKVPGILTFSNDKGLMLKTFRTSENITPNSLSSDFDSYEVILGVTNKTRITLCNCKKTNFNLFYSLDVFHTNEYSAELGFLGNHFPEGLSTTKFSRLWVDYTYLSNWASLSQYDIIQDGTLNEPNNLSIKFQKADDIILTLGNSQLKILQSILYEFKDIQTSQKISSSVEFTLKETLIFDDLHQSHILPFKQFLTFVTDEINYITQLLVWREDDIDGTEVVFRESKLESEKYSLNLRNMIFTAKEIKDNTESILNSWFNLYETNKDIINLFISTRNQSLYGENKILFLAQVFEGYHRRTLSHNSNSETAFEIRVSKIFEENKIVVEELLKAIIQKLDNTQKKKIVKKFTETLVEKIKRARHYYSHYYNETDSRPIFSNNEQLFRVTQIMRILFKSSLLREMNFNEEFIVNKITKESDFRYLQGNIRKYSLFSK